MITLAMRELFVDWPRRLKIAVGLFVLFLFVCVGAFVAFLIIIKGMEVEIGRKGFKATRPDTTLEKNCRMASQEASARDQSFNSELLALQAQKAIKDHELAEMRQKCVAAQSSETQIGARHRWSGWNGSRCNTETTVSSGFSITYATPEGDYETALNAIAEERQALEVRILAKEHERAQWQQRLDRRCLGAEASP
jgi:hypothetical protein